MACKGNRFICKCSYHREHEKKADDEYFKLIGKHLDYDFIACEDEGDDTNDSSGKLPPGPEAFVLSLFQERDELNLGKIRMLKAKKFLEDCYDLRREDAKMMSAEGEEPLSPWTITFTRNIHHILLCALLPQIVGPEIYKNYGYQLMKMFGLEDSHKSVMVIMARGFGKSQAMAMAAAMAVLCTNVEGTETAPYEILVISANTKTAKILMNLISGLVTALAPKHAKTMTMKINNQEKKYYIIDGRHVILMSGPCSQTAIRGNHIALLICDEFAYTKKVIVDEALLPIVRETKTCSIFASTPPPHGHPWADEIEKVDKAKEDETSLFLLKRNTLCCDYTRTLTLPQKIKCRHKFKDLQPWRGVGAVYPAVCNVEESKLNSALAEYMGDPAMMVGACFNSLALGLAMYRPPTHGFPSGMFGSKTYEIFIACDPTGNSEDEESGSNFSIVSFVVNSDENIVILNVSDVRISGGGMELTVASVHKHMHELREGYEYYNSCNFRVFVEGNMKPNAEEIVKSFHKYCREMHPGDPHKLKFIEDKRGKPYVYTDYSNKRKGVVVANYWLNAQRVCRYDRNIGETDGYGKLITQLGYMHDTGKIITGKGPGQRDDVAMSWIMCLGNGPFESTPLLEDIDPNVSKRRRW